MKRFRQGQKVRIIDPVHIASKFYRHELRGVIGAGGQVVARNLLDGDAFVFYLAGKSKGTRALIVFGSPDSNIGMWLNAQDCEKGTDANV